MPTAPDDPLARRPRERARLRARLCLLLLVLLSCVGVGAVVPDAAEGAGIDCCGVMDAAWSTLGWEPDWTTNDARLELGWFGCCESDHAAVEYCFSTAINASGTACRGTTVASGSTADDGFLRRTGLTLVHGQTYYGCGRVVHDNGTRSAFACTDGVTVDTVPPPAPSVVRDGSSGDQDTTYDGTQQALNWTESVDGTSGTTEYRYCIASEPSCAGTVYVSWRSPESWGFTCALCLSATASANIPAGATYYAAVRAVDLAGNQGPIRNSDGITVLPDLNPPTSPAPVNDGKGPDSANSWSKTTSATLHANWSSSTDGETALLRYDLCFSTATDASGCTGTIVAAWASTGTSSFGSRNATVVAGATYHACVRAVDRSGNMSVSCSNGAVHLLDSTLPTNPASVIDGSGADIDSTYERSSYQGGWTAGGDAGAGIASYDYCLSTGAGCTGTVAIPWTNTPYSSVWTAVTLAQGQTYRLCVRSIDNAGNVAAGSSCSDGLLITADTTPPTMPVAVNDGTGTDVAQTYSTSALSANWGIATDLHSGIAGYEYCMSTSSTAAGCAGTVVVGWTDPVAWCFFGCDMLRANATGLTLALGTTYYTCARARDTAGNVGSPRCSNGQTVTADATNPPTPTWINDGSGLDVDVLWGNTAAAGNWKVVYDGQSGLARYDWCVSTAVGCAGTVVVPWTSTSTTAAGSSTGLPLVYGTRYYVCVRAVDNAGRMSTTSCSDGAVATADAIKPPAPTSVYDGANAYADLDLFSTASSASVAWFDATDGQTGLLRSEWCIGTAKAAGGCSGTVVAPWTNAAPAAYGNSGTATGLSLVTGTVYYGCVRSVDIAGNVSSPRCSDGAMLQPAPPPTSYSLATPDDGTGSDIDQTWSTTQLDANWVYDATLTYQACASTAVDAAGCAGTVVKPWEAATCPGWFCFGTLPKSFTGLTLVQGMTYYVCIRATDASANSYGPTCSDGQTVQADTTPPPATSYVRDGLASQDLDETTTPGMLTANWNSAQDELSGTASYSICFATTNDATGCSGTVVQNWISSATTSVTATGLALAPGTTYVACVRTVDRAGNTSTTARCSDGVLFSPDVIAPVAPLRVLDGATTGVDAAATTSLTELSANWTSVADSDSGLARYDYCVSTGAGCTGTVVRFWTSAGTATQLTATGLTLVSGTTYVVCVRAVDAAGNVGSVTCSNGQVGTAAAGPVPAPTWVIDGAFGTDVDSTFAAGGISGSWAPVAPANGLREYRYCVSTGLSCSGTVMVEWTPALTCFLGCTPTTSFSQPNVPFTAGMTYYTCVRVYDSAYASSAITCSDGVLAIGDLTPPTPPSAVDDGTGVDIDSQASTTSLSANWPGGTDTQAARLDYEYCMASATGCTGTVVTDWTTISGAWGNNAMVTQTTELVSGNTYFTCVRTIDEAGNRSSMRCSDGVLVNGDVVAPPTPSWIHDGTGSEDVDSIEQVGSISSRWAAVQDAGSGLATYEHCVSTAVTCTGTWLSWWSSTTSTSAAASGTTPVGTTYYTCVRAVDYGGNRSAAVCTDGVTVVADVTPPPAPSFVNDGMGTDIDAFGYQGTASANWPWISGASAYEWCMSTITGCAGATIQPWVKLGMFSTTASTTASLTIGTTYFVCVRSLDAAGNRSAATCSDGQTPASADAVAPNPPPFVHDGLGADVDTVETVDTLAANWGVATDGDSGVTGYRTCISSVAGCAGHVLAAWAVQAGQSKVFTALQPVVGVTYFTCVQAVDAAGNRSTAACSDGQVVTADATLPPPPAWVSDASATDRDYQISWNELSAYWAAVDAPAAGGISAYEVCMSTATDVAGCTGTVIRSWVDVAGTCTTTCMYTRSAAPLAPGATYFSCVRTRDTSGNRSAATCSDGISVDRALPTAPTPVRDGLGADLDATWATGRFEANWGASIDDNSVARYEYCITTATGCGGQVVRAWRAHDASTTLVDEGVSLATGSTYFICVRAIDGAGGASPPTCSDGVLVQSDTTAPASPSPVNDGTGADVDWTASNAQVDANWGVVTDGQSGIGRYEFCVSTGASCTGTVAQDWTGTGLVTAMSTSGLSLSGGITYLVCVRAFDMAGNVSAITCSDGQAVDDVAPTAPASTNDGSAADVDWTTSTTQLVASWSAVTDAQTGLDRYEVCFSGAVDCSGTVLAGWTSAGMSTTHTATGLTFANGSTWYSCVRAIDVAGNVGATRCSDGLTVDDAVSAPGVVADGLGADAASTSSTSQLSANWTGITDTQSGLARYEYCFSTLTGCSGTIAKGWTTAGTTPSVTASGLTLAVGTTYHACVRAVDVAGNVSNVSCSNGQQVLASVTATAASPSALAQGRRDVVIQVTGSGFVSGATVAYSGTGVTVDGVSFVSSTRLDVQIDVSSTAATGGRTLTVTNPDASAAVLGNGLSITAPSISLGFAVRGPNDGSPDTTPPYDLSFGLTSPGGTVATGAVTPATSLSVSSDTDYVVRIAASDFSGPQALAASSLAWRTFGSSAAFTALTATPTDATLAAAPGSRTHQHELRLSIPVGQAAGTYQASISYSVVAAP